MKDFVKNIHFLSQGEGRPVIFLHGFCETHKIWENFIPLLSSNVKTFALDLPGFGSSPLYSSTFTLDEVAQELNFWIEAQGLKKPILIGHSLGGYISLSMIATNASLFSGLILFHSTALPDSDAKQQSRLKAIEFVRKNGVEAFVQNFIPGLFYDEEHPAVPLAMRLASATVVETFISYTLAMKDRPDRTHVLEKSIFPVLLIGGEFDPVIEADSLKRQALLNSNIDFSNLLNTSHMGFLESPEASAEAVNHLILRVSNPQ